MPRTSYESPQKKCRRGGSVGKGDTFFNKDRLLAA